MGTSGMRLLSILLCVVYILLWFALLTTMCAVLTLAYVLVHEAILVYLEPPCASVIRPSV